jgi:hypothetical protein
VRSLILSLDDTLDRILYVIRSVYQLENILLHESGVFKLCDLGSSIDEPVVFKSKAELSNVEENIQACQD